MENYAMMTFNSSGKFPIIDINSISFQNTQKSHKKGQKIHVRWDQQYSDYENLDKAAALMLESKHSSKIRNINDDELSSENLLQEKFRVQTADFHIKEISNTEPKACERQKFEVDTRESNIVGNKKISNIRYLMGQTKQLIKLIEANLLHHDLVSIKSKIIETEIYVRKLRICSRSRSRGSRVSSTCAFRSQRNQQQRQRIKTKPCSPSPQLTLTSPSPSLSYNNPHNQYYPSIPSIPSITIRKHQLLRSRIKTLKYQLSQQRTKMQQKQQFLHQEISLLKEELDIYQRTTEETSCLLEGAKGKIYHVVQYLQRVGGNKENKVKSRRRRTKSQLGLNLGTGIGVGEQKVWGCHDQYHAY